MKERYIRAEEFLPFLPLLFCYSLEGLPYSSLRVLRHCRTTGQIKENGEGWRGEEGDGEGESERAAALRGREGGELTVKPCFYCSW